MDRRRFLGRLATAGGLAGLVAGCSGGPDGDDATTTEPTAARTTSAASTTTTQATTRTTTEASPTETTATTAAVPPGEYRNPVFEPVFADPSAIRAPDDVYYAYATEDDWRDGEGPRLVPIVRSRNLVDWEYVGEAFESKPDWKDDGGLWAPDVARYRGRYYLYYSYSTWGDDDPGIGVATADDPAGPFEDHGDVFAGRGIPAADSIDPMFFLDGETPYLFGSATATNWGVVLSDDGLRAVGEPFTVAGPRYEAPYVIERDGTYYFFGSAGACCAGLASSYHVEVGRADAIEGPYLNREGEALSEGFEGSLVVDDGNGFVGPGHNCVVRDDAGTDWTLYHAYEQGQSTVEGPDGETLRRALLLDPLDWSDGFPAVENRTPSVHAERPVIESSS